MNRLVSYSIGLLLAGITGFLLISCGNWDIPTRKSQRECVKPAGNLDAQIQQRKVDFSISNSSGTIDQIAWDFGNNSTTATTGMTASYTYPTSGTYTAKATLTNTCGLETTLIRTVSVSDAVLPTVSLQTITTIATTSVAGGMTITSTGNAVITQYGICFSTVNTVPTIDKDGVLLLSATPTVNTAIPFSLTGLQPNTLYYIRSFATNIKGIVYSDPPVQTFRTGQNPVVSTNGTPSIGINIATVNYIVYNIGTPAAVEYGIFFSSTTTTPDVNSTAAKITNPPVGTYSVITLPDLIANTTYYYIPYARLPSGELIYGTVNSFKTQADPVVRDLVVNVPFTDGSLQDVSGYNNNVKLVGYPTFTTDRKGKANAAILLDGANDYFYIPENSDNSLNPDALSVSVWMKPTAFTHRMQIYNKSRFSDSAFEEYSALIKLENDTGPGTSVSTDIKQGSNCAAGQGWQDFLFTSQIPSNQWIHLVFTYQSRSVRMYLNGFQAYAKDDLPYNTMDKCPGGELKFGAAIQGLNWFFQGAMDDVRVYKRAITADEVKTLFNQ